MIAVGIVTTGVTNVSLKPAVGAGRPLGGVRNVSVWVASPSFPSASNAFTDHGEHARRQPMKASPCPRQLIGNLVAVDQQDLARERLAVVRLRRRP